jgi:uncharacterized membrane protein YhaH (DUF805 family)
MSAEPNNTQAAGVGPLARWLERAPQAVFVIYAIAAAFTTYFCMYAFRKPFAAAKFEGLNFFGTTIELKTAIVVSQILGYALSKYIGIKFCSEITPQRRAKTLVILVLIAEVALLLFGLLPNNFKIIAIFLNGIPLGMVWGLVVWYLEGRRTSELLLAGLSCSYIVASGITKDFGRAMLSGDVAQWWGHLPLLGAPISSALTGVSDGWMPFIVGLHFLPIFLLAVWMLKQLPKPTTMDVEERVARAPMTGVDRMAFVAKIINGFWWMTLTGLGSYLAYVPYGSVLFDRLMATTRFVGTAVFAIYVADSIGYTGSVGVQLYKDLGQSNVSRLSFFIGFTYVLSILGAVCMVGSLIYFLRKAKPPTAPAA